MKKILFTSLISGLLVVPQLTVASSVSSEPLTESVNTAAEITSLYNSNVVDVEISDNPIGKVVKYNENKNVKPMIAQKAKLNAKIKQLDPAEEKERENKINQYFTRIAAGEEQKFTSKFFDFLRDNNLVYYELGKPEKASIGTLSTSGADVAVNQPWVSYDAESGSWEVWGGYRFTNDYSWWGERNLNVDTQIGNLDTIGIHLTTANAAALKNGFFAQGLYHDAPCGGCGAGKNGKESERVSSRWGTIDSNNGAMFKISDKIDGFGGGHAMRWGAGSVRLTYDSKFADAHGLATVYFAHTWSTGSIDEITASKDSFTIKYSNKAQTTDTLIGGQYRY
ncbi:hypothetical protein P4H65_11420 [Paenibacillus chitinolyticus]|uniref:hypothetical protein n=1 Tax=Paenibacillus chitinolyticus TaxID=79263 RepID=UPI002DB5B297|nr:hypothetical protein [Paenibacillus chitinolyticus]MEC0246396.1 hypothetical protein [Paenibacillus chitinolyticus]